LKIIGYIIYMNFIGTVLKLSLGNGTSTVGSPHQPLASRVFRVSKAHSTLMHSLYISSLFIDRLEKDIYK